MSEQKRINGANQRAEKSGRMLSHNLVNDFVNHQARRDVKRGLRDFEGDDAARKKRPNKCDESGKNRRTKNRMKIAASRISSPIQKRIRRTDVIRRIAEINPLKTE